MPEAIHGCHACLLEQKCGCAEGTEQEEVEVQLCSVSHKSSHVRMQGVAPVITCKSCNRPIARGVFGDSMNLPESSGCIFFFCSIHSA